MASRNLRSIESKEGCPTPIEPGRGDGRKPPQPAGEQLLKTNQTTAPSAATRSPGSTDEPEEAEDKKAAAENYCTGRRGQQEAQPRSDLPPPPPTPPRPARKVGATPRGATLTLPRHHGRPVRWEPHPAPPPSLSLATTAGRE
jgi:hypothetical protein